VPRPEKGASKVQGQIPRERKEAHPRKAVEPGSASRTRAKTRTTTEADAQIKGSQPLPIPDESQTIQDVPVPPDGRTVVQNKRTRGRTGRSRSRGPRTYAEATAEPGVPPNKKPTPGRFKIAAEWSGTTPRPTAATTTAATTTAAETGDTTTTT